MIADHCGVSLMTVSDALRNNPRVAESTRERLKKVADKMGYQPNRSARELAASRGSNQRGFRGNFACLVGHSGGDPLKDRRQEGYREIYSNIAARCEETFFSLDCIWVYSHGMTAERLQKILEARNVIGLILLAVSPREITLDWEKFAVAAAIMRDDEQSKSKFHFASSDMYHAALIVVKKLAEKGYKKVGFAKEYSKNNSVVGKVSGALAVLAQEQGKAWKASDFFWNLPKKGESGATDDEASFRQWVLAEKPEVIISWNTRESLIIKNWLSHPLLARSPGIECAVLDSLTTGNDMMGARRSNSDIGLAVVDTVIGQVNRNERGFPLRPRGIIVPYTWRDSETGS